MVGQDDPAVVVIEMPFPPRELSPNAGHHHMTKHKVRKRYIKGCRLTVLTAMQLHRGRGLRFPLAPVVECSLTFVIPRLSQDADNLVAQFKAGIDALREYGVIEDDNAKRFRLTSTSVERGSPSSVRVELRGGQA